MSVWIQQEILLQPRPRGFHLITDDIVAELPSLRSIRVGLLHLLLQHTSASLTINENADPSVRTDFETVFNSLVSEDRRDLIHTYEGDDDMPAHIKSSLLGVSLTLPVRDGRLVLGTWQGIYLGEHRNQGGRRRVVATLQGQGD
ncbi:secondary thiamine-phosphate synthase enzyme YjbQ [Saccharospirillum mangrovi]|uniref:secondary thiamine-phosphate synthase enzyme YjbQ n=1 Tax=Saccharospirillum mangrovi TaxID=2161747 RepID=UPI000D3A7CC1|nr:secondary thiamine-phosphate synthase enzyme YjbQ [Saccharospirillum mangrovi]